MDVNEEYTKKKLLKNIWNTLSPTHDERRARNDNEEGEEK